MRPGRGGNPAVPGAGFEEGKSLRVGPSNIVSRRSRKEAANRAATIEIRG